MFSEAALSDKNKENAKLPLPKFVRHIGVLLYPCLQYCKRKVKYIGEYGEDRGYNKRAAAWFRYMLFEIDVFIKRYSDI